MSSTQTFKVGDLLVYTKEANDLDKKLRKSFFLYEATFLSLNTSSGLPLTVDLILIYLGPGIDEKNKKRWKFFLPETKKIVFVYNRNLFKSLKVFEENNLGLVEHDQLEGSGG
jgi:hypothetical protein